MSPGATATVCTRSGFPRASGDEPDTELTVSDPTAFSPRERG